MPLERGAVDVNQPGVRGDPAVPGGGGCPTYRGTEPQEGRGVCWRGLGQRYMNLSAIEESLGLVNERQGDIAKRRNRALRVPSGAS